MNAQQISGETYNTGLCSAVSPISGTQIMKIPFTGNITSGNVIFDMKTNNAEKFVTFGTTSVSEINTVGISVFPNPATDKIKIESPVSLDNSAVEIYSISGKLVIKTSLNSKSEINISNLPNGIYIIKINSKTVNFAKRIIKK